MRNLLDTHTLIWFLNGDAGFPGQKLTLNTSFQKLRDQIEQNSFEIISVSFEDTLIISSLPFYHNDPFDRIMVAQSIANDLIIITKDQFFKNYNIKIIW